MIYRTLFILLCAGIWSSVAASEQQTANNYSYLELSVQAVSFDEELVIPTVSGSETYNGALGGGAKLSFQPLAYGFGFLEGSAFYNSGSRSELSAGFFEGGVGGAYPLVGSLDVIGTLALTVQNVEVCSSGFCAEAEADGTVIGGGLRFKLNKHIDVLGKYEREDLDIEGPGSSASETYNIAKFELRAGREQHGFIAGLEVNDGDRTYRFGYRFNY